MDTRKYIFINGIMTINPQYGNQEASHTNSVNSLAIVSTPDDIALASQSQMETFGQPTQLTPNTINAMTQIQSADYINRFNAEKIDGGKLIDGLMKHFAKYEIPIGLISKLMTLSDYKLNFIIDDSGSMNEKSDVLVSKASKYIKKKHKHIKDKQHMTRWEEAENRLHVLIDILSYLPITNLVISFLNRNTTIALNHSSLTPKQFAKIAHEQITGAFENIPNGGTPLYSKLSSAFANNQLKIMHYVFTDGVPSDCALEQIRNLVRYRNRPDLNPLTFMSCTDNDNEAEWMKEVEEVGPNTSELDDFNSERKEVWKDQGKAFPFNKGIWLLCQLVAAINPEDLDALDESVPFSKQTMDDLLGRRLTLEEYAHYFQNNPHHKKYQHLYNHFCREDVSAKQIISGNIPPIQMPQATMYGTNSPAMFTAAPAVQSQPVVTQQTTAYPT